jgi:hypothetical protein
MSGIRIPTEDVLVVATKKQQGKARIWVIEKKIKQVI